MNWFYDLPWEVQALLILAAGILLAVITDPIVRKKQIKEAPAPEATTLADKSIPEKPQLVYCQAERPMPTQANKLAASNAERSTDARQKVDRIALDMTMYGYKLDDLAEIYGYTNVKSLRNALNRYGYRSNGWLKETSNAKDI